MAVKGVLPSVSPPNHLSQGKSAKIQRKEKAMGIKTMLLFIIYLILQNCYAEAHVEETEETKLMEHLFRNYNKRVRPSESYDQPVNMTYGIAYVQLVQLDDREQTLVSNVWIRQYWYNHFLRWNPAQFNNVTVLTVSPNLVWLPDIVLYNNAKSGIGAGTMYQYKTKVTIKYDGSNTWYAPAIIRSGCNVSITYFPLDEQKCNLHFGSWTYDRDELDLHKDQDTADITFYQKSTEFDLLSAKAERKEFVYPCCPNTTYPNIIFTIHLRRQPGFFLFNIIIPSMVITFFAILTFSSPPFIGERISLAIESFLSLSFLCMMVADSIPVNSDVSPLITQFLVTCMILISAALVFNMISMNLTGSKPVPNWLRKLAFVYIGPCIGYCGSLELSNTLNNNRGNTIFEIPNAQTRTPSLQFSTPSVQARIPSLQTRTSSSQNTRILTSENISRAQNTRNTLARRFMDMILERLENNVPTVYRQICNEERQLVEGRSAPVDLKMREYEKVRENMCDILDHSTNELNKKLNKDFWRCMAQTVDRMCMLMFSTCFIFVSAVMLLKGYGHQVKVEREYHR